MPAQRCYFHQSRWKGIEIGFNSVNTLLVWPMELNKCLKVQEVKGEQGGEQSSFTVHIDLQEKEREKICFRDIILAIAPSM